MIPQQTLGAAARQPPQAVSVARMQAIDTAAIHTWGIPRLLLMEHAGLAVARVAHARSPSSADPILLCCGTGFNGGDGLSAARHLQAWGHALRIVLAGRLDQLREEPATYAAIARHLGLPMVELTDLQGLARAERWLTACGLIIDALLGIGIRGDVREPMASLINRLNHSGKPIVAADVPSGLDADTGFVHGIAVMASVTVAFGLPKHGCLVQAGPSHTGSLVVDPISLPRALLEDPAG